MKESIIRDKSFRFGVRILKLSDLLIERRSYAIADQIVRSGTGIGSNVYEAAVAISKKEFIAKTSIAHKEAHETYYWLMLLRESEKIDRPIADSMISDCEELCKILSSIIKTSRQNDVDDAHRA